MQRHALTVRAGSAIRVCAMLALAGSLSSIARAQDTDGDELDDAWEAELGTDPRARDTDGDGLTDGQEVLDFGFDPRNADYTFNPLIADIPKVAFVLESTPEVLLRFKTDRGSQRSVSVGSERVLASEQGYEQSSSTTVGTELETSVTNRFGIETTVSASLLDFGVEGTASVEHERGQINRSSSDSTAGWSRTSKSSVQNAVNDLRSAESSTSLSYERGEVRVGVRLRNVGHMTWMIKDPVLSASTASPFGGPGALIGGLGMDNVDGESDGGLITLSPGRSSESIIFSNKDVDAQTITNLLSNDNPVNIRATQLVMLQRDGSPFSFEFDTIAQRCARVVIDYGPQRETDANRRRPAEEYMVAVSAGPDGSMSAQMILEDVLKVGFTEGSKTYSRAEGDEAKRDIEQRIDRLYAELPQMIDYLVFPGASGSGHRVASQFDEIAHLKSMLIERQTKRGMLGLDGVEMRHDGGYWIVSHETSVGQRLGTSTTTRSVLKEDFDLASIDVNRGDVISFMWMDDADFDGLGDRVELAASTDPDHFDTDLDGLTDMEELVGVTLGTNEQLTGADPREPRKIRSRESLVSVQRAEETLANVTASRANRGDTRPVHRESFIPTIWRNTVPWFGQTEARVRERGDGWTDITYTLRIDDPDPADRVVPISLGLYCVSAEPPPTLGELKDMRRQMMEFREQGKIDEMRAIMEKMQDASRPSKKRRKRTLVGDGELERWIPTNELVEFTVRYPVTYCEELHVSVGVTDHMVEVRERLAASEPKLVEQLEEAVKPGRISKAISQMIVLGKE